MLLSGKTTAQPNELTEDHAYTAFAKDEVDPQRRNALRGLAAAEKHHADLWAGRIQELGAPPPQYAGHSSGQAGSFANRVGGADLALRRLEIDEARDIARYGKQLKALGDKPTQLEGSVDVKPKCCCLFE
jgi:hypothetical protein